MNFKKAFTLVELIVVITLIGIISTMSVIFFNGHLQGVRDANRLAQLNSISDGIALKINEGKLLKPEKNVEIFFGPEFFSNQGIFGENLIDEIEYSMGGKDPKDKNYFTYVLSSNSKYFQIMGFLEDEKIFSDIGYTSEIIRNDNDRIPYVVGSKEIGIFLDDNVIPINQYENSPFVIESEDTTTYNVILKNDKIVSSSGSELFNNIAQIIDNYGDNVYGCSDKPTKFADYKLGVPEVSNTQRQTNSADLPCYFSCQSGYNLNGTYCEPENLVLTSQSCIELPDNAIVNTATDITRNWDYFLLDYSPSDIYVYNENTSNEECFFLCENNFDYNYSNNTCDPITKNAICDGLPVSNALWWESNITEKEIIQTWNKSQSNFLPFTGGTLSVSSIENECTFRCNEGYSYNSSDNTCTVATRIENCIGIATNAIWNTQSQINQTYNPSSSSWEPTNVAVYNTTASSDSCVYKCDTNYTWNGNSCEANSQIYTCAGNPSNTTFNNSSISQTWNGTGWSPEPVYEYNDTPDSLKCTYSCNSGYTWNGISCEEINQFEDTLVNKCGINQGTFDSNYDLSTQIYNGNIDCRNKSLTNTDISYFSLLKQVNGYLYLDQNGISDLSGLSNLESVSGSFDLSNNNISDLSNLSSSLIISNLSLDNNNISDLSHLSNYDSLEYLNLSDNSITNISDLSLLTNLKDLHLSNNNITDISSLYEIRGNLEKLSLDGNNSLNDLSALDRFSYSNSSGELKIDDIYFSRKISPLSKICEDWNIIDQTSSTITNTNNICYNTTGSLATFDSSNMYNDLGGWSYITNLDNSIRNRNGSYGGFFRDTNRTTSGNTGPNGPYQGNRYLFIETSYSNDGYSNKHSSLQYNLTDSANYIQFYYHAYGSNMGEAYIIVNGDFDNNGSNENQTLATFDNTGFSGYSSSWINTGEIDLPKGTETIFLYYISGGGYQGDFSIDSLSVGEKW